MKYLGLWIIFIVLQVCYTQTPVVIVRSPIPGQRIEQIPISNVIFKVVQIAPGASVYFPGADTSFQNWTVQVDLESISEGALIEIYSHPNKNNVTLEVLIKHEPVVPYELDINYIGDDISKFTISTLTIKTSHVEHWKWKIESDCNVNVNRIPDGIDSVFHLIPKSVININDFHEFILVVNATIIMNPDLFKMNKTIHVLGTGSNFFVDLLTFDSATFMDGCLSVNSHTPSEMSDFYKSQLEYYGIPVNKTLNNCISYTQDVGSLTIQVPLLYSNGISEYTKELNIVDGDLVYHQNEPIQSSKLTNTEFSWNNEQLVSISEGYTANFTFPWGTNSNLECNFDVSSDKRTIWNFNIDGNDFVLRWFGTSNTVRLNPSSNNIIPNIQTLHSSHQMLEMKLSQTNWKPINTSLSRDILWVDNKLEIFDGETSQFSFYSKGSTDYIWDMRDVKKWKTHIDLKDPNLNKLIYLNGDMQSEQGVLSLKFSGENDDINVTMNETEMRFGGFHFLQCKPKEILLDCKSCNIDAIEQTNQAEFVLQSSNQSYLNIFKFTNHAILVNTLLSVKIDINDLAYTIVNVGSLSHASLTTNNPIVEVMNGCVLREKPSSRPSLFWIETLEKLGVSYKDSLLKCIYYAFESNSLTIKTPLVIAQDINFMRDFKRLHVSSNLEYTSTNSCSQLDVQNNRINLVDQVEIFISYDTFIKFNLNWCDSSRVSFAAENTLSDKHVKWNINCQENQEKFISTNFTLGIFELCNVQEKSIVPYVDFNRVLLNDLLLNLSSRTFQSAINATMGQNGFSIDHVTNIKWSSANWVNADSFSIIIDSLPTDLFMNISNNTKLPTIKVIPSKSRVNIKLPPDTSLMFLNELKWDKLTNVFQSVDKNGITTCINPKVQCVANSPINTHLHGNMCLRSSVDAICNKMSVVQIDSGNQPVSCLAKNNMSIIQFTEPFDQIMKNPINTKLLDAFFVLLWLGSILISLIYPIGYLFDFGYGALVVAALLEGKSYFPNDWTANARAIVVFARVYVFGSDCQSSSWNLITWFVAICLIILCAIIVGVINYFIPQVRNIFSRAWILGDTFKTRSISVYLESCFIGIIFWWLFWRNWNNGVGVALNSLVIVVLVVVIIPLVLALIYEIKYPKLKKQNVISSYGLIIGMMIVNWIVIELFALIGIFDSIPSILVASIAFTCFMILRVIQLAFIIFITRNKIEALYGKIIVSVNCVLISICDIISLAFGIIIIVFNTKIEVWQMILYWVTSFLSGMLKFIHIWAVSIYKLNTSYLAMFDSKEVDTHASPLIKQPNKATESAESNEREMLIIKSE